MMRARGGFGFTMTCAGARQAIGAGSPASSGVLGRHIAGLSACGRPCARRTPFRRCSFTMPAARGEGPGGQPVSASDHAASGARALTTAGRATGRRLYHGGHPRVERAGFDGVELHGAHGYIMPSFPRAGIDLRTDRYGGSLENRMRLYHEIIDGVRARCRPDFQLGLARRARAVRHEAGEVIELLPAGARRRQARLSRPVRSGTSRGAEEAEFKGRSCSRGSPTWIAARRDWAPLEDRHRGHGGPRPAEGLDFVLIRPHGDPAPRLPARVERDRGFTPTPLAGWTAGTYLQ